MKTEPSGLPTPLNSTLFCLNKIKGTKKEEELFVSDLHEGERGNDGAYQVEGRSTHHPPAGILAANI